MPVHVRFYHQRRLLQICKYNKHFCLEFSIVKNGLRCCIHTIKMIIFSGLSAVRMSLTDLVGSFSSFLREGCVEQTVCTCSPAFRSWHARKGMALAKFEVQFQALGRQARNSANKLFYPKSLRVRREKKKKLKWNRSLLSTPQS